MAKAASDDPQLTTQQLLEARVDAMMDPAAKPTDKPVASPAKPAPKPEAKPAVPATTPSAPVLPKAITVETIVPQLVRDRPVTQKPEAAETENRLPATADDTMATAEPATKVEVAPLNIDTSQSDAAIDDIVAQEAEIVLRAEDAGIAEAVEAASYDEPELKKGHPIFWFFIILVVIIAVISAVVLTNPNLNLPFGA